MKIPFIKKHLLKTGKGFWDKLSGCTYCPLKDTCELKKQKEREQVKRKIDR